MRIRNLDTFMVQLTQLDGNLARLHQYSSTDFLTWCDQTKICHERIVALPRDPTISFSVKRKIISSYKDNLTKIILNLQFHDIITQKIHRVQGLIDAIIQDTGQLAKSASLNDEYTHFMLFPKLALLNIGLLQYINMEYKNSTGEIKRIVLKLKKNRDVADQIGLNSFDTANHAELFEGVCQNLSLALEKMSQYWVDYFNINCENVEDHELQRIRNSFSMESERVIFDSIFKMGKGIDYLYSGLNEDTQSQAENEVELF